MTLAMRERAARLAPLVLLVALVILVAGAAAFAPIILQRRMTQAFIMLVGVVGLYVFDSRPRLSRLRLESPASEAYKPLQAFVFPGRELLPSDG